MDPASALGAASAAVQFLDFVAKLLTRSIRVYRSSNDSTNDLQIVTKDLSSLTYQLQKSIAAGKRNEDGKPQESIEHMCISCHQVAGELHSALGKLRKRNETCWESFRVALKTIWTENEIDSMQHRVDGFRQQISLQILVHIQHQLDQLVQGEETIAAFKSDIKRVLRYQDQRGAIWQNNLVQALHSLRPESFRNAIQAQLRFNEMDDRQVSIPKAYHKTYEWIFNPPKDCNWSDFVEWLTNSEHLYWMTGKPGAGKSTLMKFIYMHPLTNKALQIWGGSMEVLTFSFFFWNSGSELQMSQEGLLRSILVQALNKMPALTDIVFQHRLEALTLSLPAESTWSWTELVQAFNKLLEEITKTKKLALFIDGLDEFQGSHIELIELIRGITSQNIKVCASSRPWNIFKDAFSKEPSLRLEDLTREDITFYVRDRLSAGSPVFKDIELVYPQEAATLINDVTEKASGVFLWVFLAVSSLLEGLSDGERLLDLQRRLGALPKDLEDLFTKILKSIDDKHYERAAQYFQIHATATEIESLDIVTLSFAENDDTEPTFAPAQRMNDLQRMLEAKLMERRLNACTKGLLETWGTKVMFLHRTVRDFVYSPKIWTSLEKTTRTGKGFDPKLRLAHAYIRQIKTMVPVAGKPWTDIPSDFYLFAKQGIHFAVESDPQCQISQLPLLLELDQAAQAFTKPYQSPVHKRYWAMYMEPSGMTRCSSFLNLLVACQLALCLESLLKDTQRKISQEELDTMLDLALLQWIQHPYDAPSCCFYRGSPSKDIISLLIKYGANPEATGKVEPRWAGTIRERALDIYGDKSEIGTLFIATKSSKRSRVSRIFRRTS